MKITAYLIAGRTSALATVARAIFERNKARHISEGEIGRYGTEPVTELTYECPDANAPLVKHELATKANCVFDRPLMTNEPQGG